ncbi:site-specific integrase [Streptomyces xanthophaeus]|uniref:site-specific integrase n=1 Tax=Streptomyces xanthophaeus TaxID=67385 RepID=UPI003679BDDF
MDVAFFSAEGWESWGLSAKPLIPEGMAMLVGDDLRFESGDGRRLPLSLVNEWLRLLPVSGCPAPSSWGTYARILRDWAVAADEHGVGIFDTRDRLKALLSVYAVDRSCGDPKRHLRAKTWNQHMSVLGLFYRWAVAEGHAAAVPFTYRQGVALYTESVRQILVNEATRRTPKAHVTIKYLAEDFATMFVNGLAGLRPDGTEDEGPGRFRGRHLARNGAVGELVLSSGLRLQEFTYLLACEVPALPPAPTLMPIAFPLPESITKGRKFRVTFASYSALARTHAYLGLERMLACEGSAWLPPKRWGEPLLVTEMDARGGRVNGDRVLWETLRPAQRRRLVAPDGGSMLLAVRSDGGPFTAWASVFERTSKRIAERFDPRFPHVHPHRLRHTFAMAVMERLVAGFYEQAARLAAAGSGADAALAHYLTTSEPLLVLRDLLGHSSVLTTEKYLRRLDMLRVFREHYEDTGRRWGFLEDEAAEREADTEFADEMVML